MLEVGGEIRGCRTLPEGADHSTESYGDGSALTSEPLMPLERSIQLDAGWVMIGSLPQGLEPTDFVPWFKPLSRRTCAVVDTAHHPLRSALRAGVHLVEWSAKKHGGTDPDALEIVAHFGVGVLENRGVESSRCVEFERVLGYPAVLAKALNPVGVSDATLTPRPTAKASKAPSAGRWPVELQLASNRRRARSGQSRFKLFSRHNMPEWVLGLDGECSNPRSLRARGTERYTARTRSRAPTRSNNAPGANGCALLESARARGSGSARNDVAVAFAGALPGRLVHHSRLPRAERSGPQED